MRFYVSGFTLLSILLIGLVFASTVAPVNSHAKEQQSVMGAGPSTKAAKLFFSHFSGLPAASNYNFLVEPRSIKHAGGLRASEKYLFGRTGRPLNKKEKAQNKLEIFIARIPISFVVGSKTGVKRITTNQLKKIFLRKINNWKELGGADKNIILAGREATEAAYSILQLDYSFFHNMKFDLILTRDHQLVNFLNSSQGDYAIGFGAKPNFDTRHILQVDKFNTGISLGLVYDKKNIDHLTIKAAIRFSKSKAWRKIATDSGLMSPYY